MNRSNRFSLFLVLVSIFFGTTIAHAGTVTAKKGKFSGVVKVTGATANDTKKVEQSTTPGGTTYVDTGSTIATDVAGKGSVSIANVSSGTLLKGHNVRLICSGGVICGPTVVKNTSSWFPSFFAGLNTNLLITVPQSETEGSLTFLETWEPGAIWSLILDPSEASWVDTGSASIMDTEMDMGLGALSVSSSELSFTILSDPSPLTDNPLIIKGVDLLVNPGVSIINGFYGLTGDVHTYEDNNLLLSQSLNGAVTAGPTITLVPGPIPLFGAFSAFGFSRKLRRRIKQG